MDAGTIRIGDPGPRPAFPGPWALPADVLEEYRARIINLARQERVRNYMSALRGAAKIVDNRDKVLQTAAQPGA